MCAVHTGALKLRPHMHSRPIERAHNERRVVSAWLHSPLRKKGSRRWRRRWRWWRNEESGGGREKKEEEVGGKREGNRLSTRSINRGEKIRRHTNRTKIALITIIIIMRAARPVNIVVGRLMMTFHYRR